MYISDIFRFKTLYLEDMYLFDKSILKMSKYEQNVTFLHVSRLKCKTREKMKIVHIFVNNKSKYRQNVFFYIFPNIKE